MAEPTENHELLRFIRRQVSTHGPVSFKWFMQQALYHPQWGYYRSGRARIGREGDFITSVSVSRIFGELLARQFEEMWQRMGSPVSFAIVEEGAHRGEFANDVLRWLKGFSPDLYERVRYWIVEPGEGLRAQQQARLSRWPRNKVRWCQSLGALEAGSLCGVHFSNELLDAFPVHVVTFAGGRWQENFVDLTKAGFRFVYGPPSNAKLRAHLAALPVPPADAQPYTTEVNLAAVRWIEDVAKTLRQGYVLLADYGFPREEFYAPTRREGTLSGYHAQTRNPDPLEHAGEADITAHVDFTSLAEHAESSGLHFTGYCDQHHFLVGLGRDDLLSIERRVIEADEPPSDEVLHYIRSFQMLMHPSTMGRAFKFLGFHTSRPAGAALQPLSGCRHAGDDRGRGELGLPMATAAMGPDADDPYAPF